MGAASRSKGKRGEAAFRALLQSMDWTALPGGAGSEIEDAIAIDPKGAVWCVEVKNCATITPAHKRQAMEQAKRRGKGTRWLLANHLEGTSSWLVQRQGERPMVWHEVTSEA